MGKYVAVLELTSLKQLSFPLTRVVIPASSSVEVLAHNKLSIDGCILDAGNIMNCTYNNINHKVITSTMGFFGVNNTVSGNLVILVDFVRKKIFRCIRSIEIVYGYKLITQINDKFIRVYTIPHPIRHNDTNLQQEGLDGRTFYARVAFVDRVIYYVSLHNNKEKGYRVKI